MDLNCSNKQQEYVSLGLLVRKTIIYFLKQISDFPKFAKNSIPNSGIRNSEDIKIKLREIFAEQHNLLKNLHSIIRFKLVDVKF